MSGRDKFEIIAIPMNDHTFEQRVITAMYRDRKSGKDGKK